MVSSLAYRKRVESLAFHGTHAYAAEPELDRRLNEAANYKKHYLHMTFGVVERERIPQFGRFAICL